MASPERHGLPTSVEFCVVKMGTSSPAYPTALYIRQSPEVLWHPERMLKRCGPLTIG